MLIRFYSILSVFFLFFLSSVSLNAQTASGASLLNTGLLLVSATVILVAIYLITENLIDSGHESGTDSIPFWKRIKKGSVPKYVQGHFTRLAKGHNILLQGKVSTDKVETIPVSHVAILPGNFNGMSPIPKLTVSEGDEVLAGQPIFFDKKRPEIKYVSPVSGEVVSIHRGDRRSIKEVIILADKEQRYQVVPKIDYGLAKRDDLIQFLLDTGGWTMIRQRPFDIVPDPRVIPDAIFISSFDTAPLAPDAAIVVKGRESAFTAGVDLLSRLTTGKVHLGLNANEKTAPPAVFTEVKNAEKHWFSGPHPAGNVGVQIHHIRPLSSKDIVWILGVQEVITLGNLILHQKYDASRVVVLVGEGLKKPKYVRALQGAKIAELLSGEEINEQKRIISGDVLSGQSKTSESYLNFYDDQVTVIPEGNEYELFGWLRPFKITPSVSRTYPGFLFKDLEYSVNTNTHGEGRAFVMSGQYEGLLPMDIYVQHLMKAILAKDFEKMEGLGIYELSEEDIALCEFACTSKQPLQKILRSGLNLMQEQG